MKTATIKLRTQQIGCTVTLHGVTPAELLLLVADNHKICGGDPVVSLEIEKKRERREVQEKDAAGKLLVNSDGTPKMIFGWVETDEDVELSHSPVDERSRLEAKYGRLKVSKLFMGTIPSLPEDFEEARKVGMTLQAESDRLLTVGG
jgi:hypothetical protein